jgi:hypothetical protein
LCGLDALLKWIRNILCGVPSDFDSFLGIAFLPGLRDQPKGTIGRLQDTYPDSINRRGFKE